jgi:SPP1 gp7 family putative phage head morphogenesis protein
MTEIDEQIKQEIFFEKYKYISVEQFEETLKSLNEKVLLKLYSENTTIYSKKKLNELLKYIEEIQTEAFLTVEEESLKELEVVSTAFIASESKMLNTNFDKKLLDGLFNPENDMIFGYHFTELFQTANKQSLKRVKTILSDNLLQGKNPKSFSNELYNLQVKLTKKQVLTNVRTYAKTVRENIRNETEKKYKDMKGWISLATLDSRTTPICIKLDKEFYSADKYDNRQQVPDKPPRHFNCRSLLVRVSEDTLKYTRQATGDEGGTQVKTNTSFDSFLKRNPNTAEKLMGPKRFELYKSGKYKITDFINDDGRFFTLRELEKEFGL